MKLNQETEIIENGQGQKIAIILSQIVKGLLAIKKKAESFLPSHVQYRGTKRLLSSIRIHPEYIALFPGNFPRLFIREKALYERKNYRLRLFTKSKKRSGAAIHARRAHESEK